jgi:hypothetical protein
MLQSQLLSPNPRLQACEVEDQAHVKLGDHGDFVGLIQQALASIDSLKIEPGEVAAARYGPSTAAAVLAYKTKRGIINTAYQTSPDNIVGKMTIRSLDDELLAIEALDTPEFFAGGLRNARGHML